MRSARSRSWRDSLGRGLLAGGLAVPLLLVPARVAGASPIIDIAGSTLGCWQTAVACSSYASSTTLMGVTFDQAAFYQSVDFSASPWPSFTVGSFTRSQQSSFNNSNPFSLQVSFALPSGIGAGVYSATIAGNAAGSGGATLFDFVNTLQQFNFSNSAGTGSFWFGVLDPGQLTRGQTVSLLGTIQNMQFTPAPVPGPAPVPVPEPASLLLLGSGLAVTAAALRRRRR